MKLIKLLSFTAALIFITSCSVIYTTHQFYHHGTDTINTTQNFKYVEFGVVGKARTTYYPNKLRPSKQQVPVDEGLIADAKKNLHSKYPLKSNQAYANLTIDVLNTTKGTPSSNGTVLVEEITLEAVVSADIIEYYK